MVEKVGTSHRNATNRERAREQKKDADGGRDDDGLGNGVLCTRCVRDRDGIDGLINGWDWKWLEEIE